MERERSKVVFNARLYMVLGTIRAVARQGDPVTVQNLQGYLAARGLNGSPCTLSQSEITGCLARLGDAGLIFTPPNGPVSLRPKGSMIADQLEGMDVWGHQFAQMSKEMLCISLLKPNVRVSQHECAERLGYSSTAIRAGMQYWINSGDVVAERIGTQICYRLTQESEKRREAEPSPAPSPAPSPDTEPPKSSWAPQGAVLRQDPLSGFQQLADLLGVPVENLLQASLDALRERLRANFK